MVGTLAAICDVLGRRAGASMTRRPGSEAIYPRRYLPVAASLSFIPSSWLCRKQDLETNRNLSTLCLGGKHIELFGGCFQVSPRCIHLSFLDHRHHLDTG